MFYNFNLCFLFLFFSGCQLMISSSTFSIFLWLAYQMCPNNNRHKRIIFHLKIRIISAMLHLMVVFQVLAVAQINAQLSDCVAISPSKDVHQNFICIIIFVSLFSCLFICRQQMVSLTFLKFSLVSKVTALIYAVIIHQMCPNYNCHKLIVFHLKILLNNICNAAFNGKFSLWSKSM